MERIPWSRFSPNGEGIHLAYVTLAPNPQGYEHSHDFYECFLVEGGRGQHLLQGEAHPLKVGELYFIRPEHIHGFRTSGTKPLTIYNVAFEANCFEQANNQTDFLANHWKPQPQPSSILLSTSQREAYRQLVAEAVSSPHSLLDASFFLLGLARLLRPLVQQVENRNLPAWLQDVLPVAREADNLRGGLAVLNRLCGHSPEHVCRSFRRYLDLSPSQWLKQERIRYARCLLETSTLTILDVGLECGFENPTYFHSCFRELCGKTPLQYRKEARALQMPISED